MTDETKRLVVVTGGESGIGHGIVERLLADGDRILSIGLGPAEAIPGHAFVAADLTTAEGRKSACDAIAAAGATALVHNAGVIRPALLGDIEERDLDYVVDLHLRAAIVLVQAMLPALRSGPGGRIVLISSRGAAGLQTRSVYSATKAGLIGMGRTWALELAPFGTTVNIVSPGPVQSPMFRQIVPEGSGKEEQLARSIPVGRIGRPDDVANAVSFFLDARSDFVTGQNLLVCGGASVGLPIL